MPSKKHGNNKDNLQSKVLDGGESNIVNKEAFNKKREGHFFIQRKIE